jgi:acyl-CoA synthetase (AMP-forming)/AMP-acid ligase II
MADLVGFINVFRRNMQRDPDMVALAHLFSGDISGVAGQRLSYSELDRSARSIAAWLQQRCRPGDRALLLFPAGLDFTQAFLGCLYAGLVPVPAPFPGNDRRQIDRTMNIAVDAEMAVVLTSTTDAADALRRDLADAPLTNAYEVVALADAQGDPADWVELPVDPEALALLQYTSGSTSEPKGVMVRHANLVDNLDAILRQAEFRRGEVCVTWLPHFHDMGLIGTLLAPLYHGGTIALLSPIAFLQRPVRWLEAISHWRATWTTAPNFAYDLCSRVVTDEQIAALDLSCMRWALNGAEPVRAATLTRFSERFASAGFRAEVFAPCYGMAENTLLVTSTRPGTPPVIYAADQAELEQDRVRPGQPDTRQLLAGCGRIDEGRVFIVDPQQRTIVEPGQIGEIWLAGGSVAAGYWRRPTATAEDFGAYASDGSGPYLRTGDLGAVLDGELYITGRLKDVVIVHGRNLYPQDIEFVVRETHPALGAGTGVVFAVTCDREHIVVVHEFKAVLLEGLTPAELSARVQLAVARAFDVPVPSVVLTNRGGVRRTTSGKVQRRLMRSLFLEQKLRVVHEDVVPAVRALQEATSEPANA